MTDAPGRAGDLGPLLETKLYIPKRRSAVVARPRLLHRLDQGARHKLTVVSAPAGFGKTTLLADWAISREQRNQRPAWVSLDQGDHDPTVFWTYVFSAMERVRSGVGARALALLRSPSPPRKEWVLTDVINEISSTKEDLVVILDDYQAIDADPVHASLTFFLDHMPPQVHLVIATRSDPPLPLASLRARGELTELRARDLRFTLDEAADFLRETMSLDLSDKDVATLEARTEGWIAALQVAALSMQGREDVSQFIQTFSGEVRYIVDYLVEEVLQRQSPGIRSFLLQTSILDRLSGALCDAVTGRDDSQDMLESLERSNLFVVPLDDRRHWFRYHHLFADVIRAYAIHEEPGQLPILHGRASQWYERNGGSFQAIGHALAAEDFGRAADMVELAARAILTGRRDEKRLLDWLEALPDEVIRPRPVLSVYHALALLPADLAAAEARLQDAERWVEETVPVHDRKKGSQGQATFVDEEGFQSLAGTIAIARAYHAGAVGDLRGIVQHARRAVNLLPEGDHLWRGAAAGLLGLAHWTRGDLEAAYRAFVEGGETLRMTGDMTQDMATSFVLASIKMQQGRLREAAHVFEQALARANRDDRPMPPAAADLYVGLSELCCEHNDLTAASEHLKQSKAVSERGGIPEHRHRWYTAMARIEGAQGNPDRALGLLDEAQALYIPSPAPDVRPIPAMKARVQISQGRLDEAGRWVQEQGLTVDDDLSYLREFEHITLARFLMAGCKHDGKDGSIRGALAMLKRLESAAQAGGRTGRLIEILVLQALAHQVLADTSAALRPLDRALALAEPEGYVRIFVDEGPPMHALLRRAALGEISGSYALQLLAAFDDAARSSPAQSTSAARLVEQLTDREVEILRLIAAGMRNQEIADHLFISLSTVKRHIANAYGKLEVRHRVEAIARIRELDLL